MSKFTPGPWTAKKAKFFRQEDAIVYDASHENIATVWKYDGSWANANLISAAPDLYEALDNLLTKLAHTVIFPDDALVEEMRAAEVALDKAAGETQ